MKTQSTLLLTTLPQESLRALEKAVASHFDWRMMTGRGQQARFVIEKRVRYDIARGLPIYANYQIVGSFQTAQNGETALHYTVSGGSIPLIHGGLYVGAMLAITTILTLALFNPNFPFSWLAVALVAFALVSTVVYGFFAYRSYQGHLKELVNFMESFARQMNA